MAIKMRVALIGYGRSGWRIHGAFFKKEDNDICDVIAVVEYDPARQAAAKADFCCDTYSDYKELFRRDDINLVVSACYSNEHYAVALDLLNHGHNVLHEKLLCKTPQLAQGLIDAA